MENRPFYNKLYADMIRDKYPEKTSLCIDYLKKTIWTALDVIRVNHLLFGHKKDQKGIHIDQRHRSYDEQSIKEILCYQKVNMLNNKQVANKFRLSRNTIARWKRLFPEI